MEVSCCDPRTALRIVLYAASVLFSSLWISGCCLDGTVSDPFGRMVEAAYSELRARDWNSPGNRGVDRNRAHTHKQGAA
jgi:hypothetical protein